jgi:hypothetical protein
MLLTCSCKPTALPGGTIGISLGNFLTVRMADPFDGNDLSLYRKTKLMSPRLQSNLLYGEMVLPIKKKPQNMRGK